MICHSLPIVVYLLLMIKCGSVSVIFELRHEKKGHNSYGNRKVSDQLAPLCMKKGHNSYANSKGSAQPAHLHSLIRACSFLDTPCINTEESTSSK